MMTVCERAVLRQVGHTIWAFGSLKQYSSHIRTRLAAPGSSGRAVEAGFPISVSDTKSLLISGAFIHAGFNALKMLWRSARRGARNKTSPFTFPSTPP
jgi:hypothetical protein